EESKEAEPTSEKTDEELFEECEVCHVAVAASRFAEICTEHPEGAGASCKLISAKLEDETTEPTDWIKTMVKTAEQAQGEAKEEMVAGAGETGRGYGFFFGGSSWLGDSRGRILLWRGCNCRLGGCRGSSTHILGNGADILAGLPHPLVTLPQYLPQWFYRAGGHWR
ncbi:unnamed protein product, partial [marine sediment metagenome]